MDKRSRAKDSRVGPYQFFMLGLCVYVLLALAAEAFFRLDEDTKIILWYADTGVCVIFLIDFVRNMIVAENRVRYFVTWGWIDLVSSIPAVGTLRIGRVARVFRILRLLRGVRSTRMLSQFILERRAESAFLAVALISVLLVVFSSVAILHFEKGGETNILDGDDALWWSFVTITTVGYGDKFPVTVGGRCVAAVLMVAGVGLFGTFTGFIASWFVEADEDETQDEIQGLRREIAELKDLVRSRRRPNGG